MNAAENLETARLLLNLFADCTHILVYYDTQEIEREYRRRFSQHTSKIQFIEMVFSNFIRKNKFQKVSKIRIRNDFNFDSADLKFLEVAISVQAAIISGDSDFLDLRERMQSDRPLRSRLKNIRIWTPSEAHIELKLGNRNN